MRSNSSNHRHLQAPFAPGMGGDLVALFTWDSALHDRHLVAAIQLTRWRVKGQWSTSTALPSKRPTGLRRCVRAGEVNLLRAQQPRLRSMPVAAMPAPSIMFDVPTETRDERRLRSLVDLGRCADLLDLALVEDGDVRSLMLQRLFLIVRDETKVMPSRCCKPLSSTCIC